MTAGRGWIAIVTVALFGGCARAADEAPARDYEADRVAIRALHDAEEAAAEAADVDAAMEILSSDITFLEPNGPIVIGEAGVREWLQGFLDLYTVSFENYGVDEILVDGDLAVERYSGTWTVTPRDGGDPMTEAVKGLHVYRRQADGSWKMTHDVWNSDTPLPGT
jgi:ketosteroid isomerase-like protein